MMNRTRKTMAWAVPAVILGLILAASLFSYLRHRKPVVLMGAVIVQDADTNKELPIAGVEVTAANGLAPASVRSDSSGLFSLPLRPGVRRRRPITLQFRRSDYQPLDLAEVTGDKLYIVHMVPLSRSAHIAPNQPIIRVANVRVRYSSKTMTVASVGSAVKAFQIENIANLPCNGQAPCSPDGKWKASIGSASLDAGPGNQFQNVRASCIAGPCPFTEVESDRFAEGAQVITLSVKNWSDNVTFLLEAEVFHPMASEIVHESYPVIFGQTLNFTLPASAEGVTIRADINGETIFYPLGPSLFLSWANCDGRINSDETRVYRCELKPNFRF